MTNLRYKCKHQEEETIQKYDRWEGKCCYILAATKSKNCRHKEHIEHSWDVDENKIIFVVIQSIHFHFASEKG